MFFILTSENKGVIYSNDNYDNCLNEMVRHKLQDKANGVTDYYMIEPDNTEYDEPELEED